MHKHIFEYPHQNTKQTDTTTVVVVVVVNTEQQKQNQKHEMEKSTASFIQRTKLIFLIWSGCGSVRIRYLIVVRVLHFFFFVVFYIYHLYIHMKKLHISFVVVCAYIYFLARQKTGESSSYSSRE